MGYVSTDHDSIIETALLRTASYLCTELCNDHAVLFPQLYRKCYSYVVEVTDGISRGRVLSYLRNQFGDLLSSVYHNRKLVQFSTGQRLILLSNALSRNPDSDIITDEPFTISLNASVNKLVTHLVAETSRDAKQWVNLDVEAFITTISKFAPGLWSIFVH